MEQPRVDERILEALETEIGGASIYRTALRSAKNADPHEEWTKDHQQTDRHVEIVRALCGALSIDPERQTPGRRILQHKAKALIEAMDLALASGDLCAAQLVACECVVDAESKDHSNWELIGELARQDVVCAGALVAACEAVEEEEDEHLYHSQGWARELQLASLGLRAVLPPPEERMDVKTAIGAARAKQHRRWFEGAPAPEKHKRAGRERRRRRMFEPTAAQLEIVARVALIYLGMILLLRLAGKRELGQLAPLDLLGMLLAWSAGSTGSRWCSRAKARSSRRRASANASAARSSRPPCARTA
jgi:hypothetical protein